MRVFTILLLLALLAIGHLGACDSGTDETPESSTGSRLTCVDHGKLSCKVKCQQGKKIYPYGCCSCTCKKNFAKINDTSCAPAAWTQWTTWSECLVADWGGIQTKERICKTGDIEAPGSCVGKGSMGRRCSPIIKEFRIRKNVKDLTDEEIHDYIQAMTKFKEDKTDMGFRKIASWHGWPGMCPWYHNITYHADNHCSWHYHPMFFPWHRLMTTQLEMGLNRHMKNKTLGAPFWDWTADEVDLPYLLRNRDVFDPILKKFVHNPFHKTFIKNVHGEPMTTQRYPYFTGLFMSDYHLKGAVRGLLCHSHYEFDKQHSSNPHDQIHNCFCHGRHSPWLSTELCRYGMPETLYSAWDPAFMFHHSAIDRLFLMRRKIEETAGVQDWTRSRVIGQYLKNTPNAPNNVIEAFDWPFSPFCNKTMNFNPVTNNDNVWTMRRAYYGEELFGYKYDNFDFGGKYTWDQLVDDYKKNVVDGEFWNDETFDTAIGQLNPKNSYGLKSKDRCVIAYHDPQWNVTVVQEN